MKKTSRKEIMIQFLIRAYGFIHAEKQPRTFRYVRLKSPEGKMYLIGKNGAVRVEEKGHGSISVTDIYWSKYKTAAKNGK